MGPENDDSIDINTSQLARKCAQIKQRLRLARCIHPEKSLVIKLLFSDGYIEYCSDCDKVTSVYDP